MIVNGWLIPHVFYIVVTTWLVFMLYRRTHRASEHIIWLINQVVDLKDQITTLGAEVQSEITWGKKESKGIRDQVKTVLGFVESETQKLAKTCRVLQNDGVTTRETLDQAWNSIDQLIKLQDNATRVPVPHQLSDDEQIWKDAEQVEPDQETMEG